MASQVADRFRRAALPKWVDQLAGHLVENGGRQADPVDAFQLHNGGEQALQVGLARVGLQVAQRGDHRFPNPRRVGFRFVTFQQPVDGGLAGGAQSRMNGRLLSGFVAVNCRADDPVEVVAGRGFQAVRATPVERRVAPVAGLRING